MKVALVTGASRGIGACIAEGLAADGYALALVARSKEDLEKVARRIAKNEAASAPQVAIYALDIQDEKAIESMVSSVMSSFGQIDLLINNAGMARVGTLNVSVEQFDRLLAVNLRGQFSMLKAVVPGMKERRSGMIINIASTAGKTGFAEYGAYAASKFGLVGLSESLYHELLPQGIKVTALCPSWVDTDMTKDAGIPQEEMLRADDLLTTVRYLLQLSAPAAVKELTIQCRIDVN